MDNSPYEPPKTNSEYKSPPYSHPSKWSQRKLLLLTFTPAFIGLISAPLMLISEDFFVLALFGAPIAGLIISVLTAINFSTSRPYTFLAHLILWLVAHTALVFLSFVGCTFLAGSIGSLILH